MFVAGIAFALMTVGGTGLLSCSGLRDTPLAAPVVLPFELRGDLALVSVQVNGTSALLILDSGSGAVVLDSEFADQSGISWAMFGNANANGVTSVKVRMGSARDIRLGAASLTGATIAAMNLDALRARVGSDVRGTLGYDLFARYVVTVDYRARTITLAEPGQFTYQGSGAVIPVTLIGRTPVAAATITTRTRGTINAQLMLDLGSTSWALRLSSKLVDDNLLDRDTATVRGILGTGAEGTTEGQLLRMPSLQLGTLVIARPSTALSHEVVGAFGRTAQNDGTIGVPVFRRTRMIVDYARKRVILEPTERLDVQDSVDAAGIAYTTPSGDGAASSRVTFVVEGSAAALAGVRVGDELVRVDSTQVNAGTMSAVRALLREAGSKRTVTVRRSGTLVTISMLLKMVI